MSLVARMLWSAISALFLAYYRLRRGPVLYFMAPDVLMDLRNSALAATQRHSGIQCKLVSLFVRCIAVSALTLSKSDHGFSCTFLLMGVFVVTHTSHRASLCSIDHGQEGNEVALSDWQGSWPEESPNSLPGRAFYYSKEHATARFLVWVATETPMSKKHCKSAGKEISKDTLGIKQKRGERESILIGFSDDSALQNTLQGIKNCSGHLRRR